MKKIGKINLVSQGDKQFTKQELINLKGGYSDLCCGCGCPGGEDDWQNQDGNWEHGYSSSIGGSALYCWENDGGNPVSVDKCV